MHDISTIRLSLVIHLLYIYNIDADDNLHNLHSHCMYMCIMRGRLKLALSECTHNLKLIIKSYHVVTENYKNILTCISLSVLVCDDLNLEGNAPGAP